MCEIVTVVRALLANETVTVHREFVHVDGGYQERRPKDMPIHTGATRMQMLTTSGTADDARAKVASCVTKGASCPIFCPPSAAPRQ